MTWVNTTVNLKPLRTTIIVAVTTTILYYLTIGIAVDAVDGFVEADLASGTIPDVSILNYILAIYTIMICGSMLISASLLSHDARVAGVSILAGLIMMVIVVFISLMSVPGLVMSPDKWFIAPALCTAFVMKDAGLFLLYEVICITSIYCFLTLRTEVFKQW